jgi:hypothetical protein
MLNVFSRHSFAYRVATLLWAVLFAVLFAAPPCARAQSPIAWQLGDFAGQPGQRLGLAVEAQVNGHPCTMRIDTGLDAAVQWSDGAKPGKKAVDVALEFAGVHMTIPASADKARQLAHCNAADPVGALGNAFFDSGTLAIDLKTSQVRFATGGLLAARLDAQPMVYARWTPQGGYPLVEIRKGGALRGYAMLDTGNAALTFAPATRPQWDAAIAPRPDANANTNAPAPAADPAKGFSAIVRGHALSCLAANAAAALQAGTWTLTSPQVIWCPPADLAPPLKLEGTLGLRGFRDAVVTLDYVSGRWLVEKAR